jgi:ketosteroid isomerase-like protein
VSAVGDDQARDAVRGEVLAALQHLVEAFGRHDTATYLACFDDTATFVFHTSERVLTSRADYESEWREWEHSGFRVLGCTSRDARVDVVGDGVAVVTHRVRTRVRPAAGAPEEELRERETVVLRRSRAGRWQVVHEHLGPDPAA